MKKILPAVISCIALSSVFAAACFCAETKAPADAKAESAKKTMTREETISALKDILEGEDEIFNAIPELKVVKDAKGGMSYIYRGIRLEDMSKEDADALMARVHQNLTRLNTERIQMQLENVQRAERLRAVTPPRPPSIPQAVPQPPQTPSNPSSSTRVPAAPPPVPARR